MDELSYKVRIAALWLIASGSGKVNRSDAWRDLGVSILHRLVIESILSGANLPNRRLRPVSRFTNSTTAGLNRCLSIL